MVLARPSYGEDARGMPVGNVPGNPAFNIERLGQNR